MNILIFGGTGFVGINVAFALLARGHAVTLFDRGALPRAAAQVLAGFGNALNVIEGDVAESRATEAIVAHGFDSIVLGAAITAGPAREAADPQLILQVNLLAQVPLLMAAHRHRVRRVINLSSGSAFGAAAFRHTLLDEELPCEPVSLYAVTKHASERLAARLSELWQANFISASERRIRAMGARHRRAPVAVLVEAAKPKHALYHISTAREWTALEWGEHLAALNPGFVCRLAGPGEHSNVDLHSDADRAPLSISRMTEEFGWRARFGCADSAADLNDWRLRHGEHMTCG